MTDAGIALALGLLGVAQLIGNQRPFEGPHNRPPSPEPFGRGPEPSRAFPPSPDVLTYGLLGLCAGSLVLRRRNPLISLGLVTAFAAAYLIHGGSTFSVQLIALFAMYSAVADTDLPRLVSVLVAGGAAVVLGVALLLAPFPPDTSAVWAMDAAWAVAAILLGDSAKSHRAYSAELERTREEESRRRLTEERLSIARELHDVVGHNIALINVQAGAGSHVLYKESGKARDAFESIRLAAHETLQELRSIVGVLREPTEKPALSPVAGINSLQQLVKATRDAGQQVDLVITGEERPLSGVVDVSLYRVLQEALTNTLRHAPKARVQVHLDFGEDEVSREVTNDRGADGATPESGGGHGLEGMRERVAAIGGWITAEPTAGGGFRVEAVIPAEKDEA